MDSYNITGSLLGSSARVAGAAMEGAHQRLGQVGWLVLGDLLPADTSSKSSSSTSLAAAAEHVRRQARAAAGWPGTASRPATGGTGTEALRFPADATAWSAVNHLALHRDILAGAALLLGQEETDVRLVAASLLAPWTAAATGTASRR